jgi:type IV pilus assembly protein PilY1
MALSPLGTASAAATVLADAPIFATKKVPPNLMLDLSVEWPTGVVAAYNDNLDTTPGFDCPGRDNAMGICYFDNRTYLGYFDPLKCYDYVGTPGTDSTAPSLGGYFTPSAFGSGPNNHQCSGKWSGNFLNWATMQAVDTFRWNLTGGDRVVDTASQTIVEKARHSGQGRYNQFPIKRIRSSGFTGVPGVNPSTVGVLPISFSEMHLRVHNDTTTNNTTGPFFVDFYGGATWTGPQFQVDCDSSWNNACLRTYYARVEVCKPGMLEANCRQYGSSWKPTGLIQQNSDRMRFGVFGYLLDSVRSRAGGVMRAKLKDVGPMTIDPVAPPVANTRKEFSDVDGTYVANPDTADAGASGVSQSGVINYLNKFGKASPGYKSTDTISEMYYESLRYLKNMGSATPQYVAGLTNPMKDGFPVIQTWDDPVQYSCQKNYIVMIADVNAWCDFALPGTSITSNTNCSGHSSLASSPIPGLNVTTQVNAVGKLDNSAGWNSSGFGNLSTAYANNSGSGNRGNTWYLAGLAYWANTNNLRPDKTAGTSDRVTAQTYMVDVAETGSWFANNAANLRINQMWLAAKYGGFDDINLNGTPANQGTWDKNSDGVPDNYFLASRPDVMGSSLSAVFNDVLSKTEASAGATLISSQVQSGDSIYEVQYSSNGWIGEVFGLTIDFAPNGDPIVTPSWTARTLLDSQVTSGGWDTSRKIATWDGTAGVPFRIVNITPTQQGTLGPNATVRQEVLNFLRGDRSKEGSPYRTRKGILGDIVSAEAVPTAAPQAPYLDGTNPGYSAFRTANLSRPKVVYVASNDGMLHALAGATPGGGQELFAYVPSFGFNGPNATPSIDGLAALAQPGYTHRFYVDATPVVADVDFARTGGNPAVEPQLSAIPDWRSILVGGLGKGGKGFYALDITNPTAMAVSETALASKVLWEFTDPDMGYSYGKPIVAKLRQHGWVVMVTSGYNNLDGTNKGQGFLYILNAKTGTLIQKIATNAGNPGNPSGFTHAAGYSLSFADFTVEQVYGGDLLGNVWRFDVSQVTGAYPDAFKIAELKDSASNPQPVTSAPRVEISLNGITRWVFIGTGKLLDNTDMGNTQTQTMYAFKDGSKSTPAGALPPGITHPLQRADFVTISDAELLTGVTVPPNKIGWLHDLTGLGPAGSTERISFDPVANSGTVAWVGNIPSVDPCSPGVSSRTYAVNYETGKTALLDTPGGSTLVPFVSNSYGLVKLQFVKVGDRVQLLSSDRNRKVTQVPGQFGGAAQAPRRLNWREIIN